ncbi:MAG: multidrug ABC transporter ATPase [Mycetocola sp.]
MTDPQKHNVSRFERVLAFMLLALVLLSVATFIAIMVGTMQGMGSDDFASGLWPVVVMVPYIGLPLAIVLLIILMISSAVRRARESRRDQPER